MNPRIALLSSVLLILSCERKSTTTPPDTGGDDGSIAADDAGGDDSAADDADEEGKNDEGSDRPVPVEQVLKVEGPLTQQVIDDVMRHSITTLRDCFDQVMENPDAYTLNGAVVVRFVVGKDGKVTSAIVELDEVGHKGSASCLAKAIESATFPKQKDESTVHLPLYENNF